MNAHIQKDPEVAIIMANIAPVDGWSIYWVLSKMQVEYILREVAVVPAGSGQPHLGRASYQEKVLPVLSLEQYFGLQEEPSRSEGYKYVVTKTPVGEDTIARTILRFSHPIRIRKLIFNATEARHTGLLVNSGDILGAFTLPENQLLIVPDVAKIHQNVR